jgi:thiamine-phosphate pyrophosphorylase
MQDQRPRLMLFTPPVADAAAFAAPLREAMAGGEPAAVAITLVGEDERALVNMLKTLVPIVQAKEAAALVVDRPDIVARGGADGLHATDPAIFAAAIDGLKAKERIVGAGRLALRDDAMTAAERGADYVLFGDADQRGHAPPLTAIAERASWWASIFETPCVALAPSLDSIAELAATGAEFIAFGEAVWTHPGGPGEAVRLAMRLLSQSVTA